MNEVPSIGRPTEMDWDLRLTGAGERGKSDCLLGLGFFFWDDGNVLLHGRGDGCTAL